MDDSGTSREVDAAWDNLMDALEMWEGSLWRSKNKMAGLALCRTTQARRLLEHSRARLSERLPSK